MSDNDNDATINILQSILKDDRWEAWRKHMRSKGMETTREEFERYEEEYLTAPTEQELFTKYLHWCAATGRPLGDRETFVRALRVTYPKSRMRGIDRVYPGVKVRELFK